MTEAGEPLTDQEMEGVISAFRAAGNTVNLEFDSCTWEVAPLAVYPPKWHIEATR
jgi:hypothetical protein